MRPLVSLGNSQQSHKVKRVVAYACILKAFLADRSFTDASPSPDSLASANDALLAIAKRLAASSSFAFVTLGSR